MKCSGCSFGLLRFHLDLLRSHERLLQARVKCSSCSFGLLRFHLDLLHPHERLLQCCPVLLTQHSCFSCLRLGTFDFALRMCKAYFEILGLGRRCRYASTYILLKHPLPRGSQPMLTESSEPHTNHRDDGRVGQVAESRDSSRSILAYCKNT